jgi:ferric iron reductase protein FhuF
LGELEAALARAGTANPLLTFAPDADVPATEFAAGPLVDAVGAWLGARERRVAASLVVLGYAARLVGPTVAVLLRDGVLVDARPAAVRFDFVAGRGFRLALVAPAVRPGGATGWRRDVVDDHLSSVVAAVHRDTPVAPALLWGNVASGLIGALAALARSGAVPARRCAEFAATALADGPLAGSGDLRPDLAFRRRNCCLYYRLPGGGYCGDCPLPRSRKVSS